MSESKPFYKNFSNTTLNFIYGILCFLGAPVLFFISKFYISFCLSIIFYLLIYITIPDEFMLISYLLYGFFTSFWGMGIFNKKQILNRKLTSTEELNTGFNSISESLNYILLTLFITLYFYAIITLLGVKNEILKNIFSFVVFIISYIFILSKMFSNNNIIIDNKN